MNIMKARFKRTILDKTYHVTQQKDMKKYMGSTIDEIHAVVTTEKLVYRIDLEKYTIIDGEKKSLGFPSRMAIFSNVTNITPSSLTFRVMSKAEQLLGEMVKVYEITHDDFKQIWRDVSAAMLADVKKHIG